MSMHHYSGPPPVAVGGMAADETMRKIDDAVELTIRRHEVFAEAHQQIEHITFTHRSPDGAVEITVGSNGNLLNVRCAGMIRTMPPHQIAATVQHCVQAAQAGIARRVEEILRTTAPGDPLTDELVANAHKSFPSPPTAAPLSAPEGSGPRQMTIGGIEDDEPKGPRRTARRRPLRGHDGYQDPDDWAGRSILS